MVTPGEAATIKVEPSLLKPAARTSSVPVMVNGSRCPASCSAAMPPARINSRQPWPVRFGSRPPARWLSVTGTSRATGSTQLDRPALGIGPVAGELIEVCGIAGGHIDNRSALVADNQEEVGHQGRA